MAGSKFRIHQCACNASWAAVWWLAPVVLMFAAQTGSALEQGFVVRTWGTESGLPQNTVNAIVQTRDGYMWLATREGLARFDGLRFTVFGLRDGLESVAVQTLLEDRQGTL